MTRKFPRKVTLLLLLAFAFTLSATAQSSRTKRTQRTTNPKIESASKLKKEVDGKRISEKDRKAIINLFKDVDPKKYRLQFYNGEKRKASKYGRLSYRMNDLKRVQKLSNPVNAVGWIVFVVEGDDVIYVLAVGSDKVKNVLGAAKTKRLNAIMAKYR